MTKQPLDTRHPAIRETLWGIARTHGESPRRSAALTTDDIKKLVAACDDDTAGLRDQALFLVCFAGALRRSELVSLDVEHVTWLPKGMRLLITRSKTDKEGAGAEVGIPHGRASVTCPVTALKAWLERGNLSLGPFSERSIAAVPSTVAALTLMLFGRSSRSARPWPVLWEQYGSLFRRMEQAPAGSAPPAGRCSDYGRQSCPVHRAEHRDIAQAVEPETK